MPVLPSVESRPSLDLSTKYPGRYVTEFVPPRVLSPVPLDSCGINILWCQGGIVIIISIALCFICNGLLFMLYALQLDLRPVNVLRS
jgi:hypothetical protein